MTVLRERIEGGLLGLLVGDALGVPYEFHGPEELPARELLEFTPPDGFRRAHQSAPPGTWSDDGAQALCLLASLLEHGRLDLGDFGRRMVNWFDHGYLAVDGRAFDIGNQTRIALRQIAAGVDVEQAARREVHDNGNGSLMRVLPLALWHRGNDSALIDDAMRSSVPTHGHLRSQLCCAVYCLWARRLLEGAPLQTAWDAAVAAIEAHFNGFFGGPARSVKKLAKIELAEIDLHRAPGGRGSGYVVDCLHSARLALTEPSYEGVVKAAIALGHDTDTTAAVAGGIAGIVFGIEGIPTRWRQDLRGRELLDPLRDRLLDIHA
jgi:ADP-ribosyl-[dinitrogen reductase] hydrolase